MGAFPPRWGWRSSRPGDGWSCAGCVHGRDRRASRMGGANHAGVGAAGGGRARRKACPLRQTVLIEGRADERCRLARWIVGDWGLELAGTAEDGRTGFDLCARAEPVLAIVDLDLPDCDGIELVRRLRRGIRGVRLLGRSRREDPVWWNRAMEVGLHGFVGKTDSAEVLREAMSEVAGGSGYFPAAWRELQDRLRRDPRGFSKILTGREQDILRHVVEGRTSRRIAELLGLSPRSVETFRYRLMRKLGVGNAAGLIEYAFRNGLCAVS